MRRLLWTEAARRDLLSIWAWKGREVPERGDRALDRIEPSSQRLTRFPRLGPTAPHIAPGARKLSVDEYLVLYRIAEDSIVIVRVVDQRMLLERVETD